MQILAAVSRCKRRVHELGRFPMAAIVGWYGPLIDLVQASSYVDEFVQLLVFVHSSQLIQKVNPAAKEGTLLRTRMQVADGTRTYFSVTIWPNHIKSAVTAGDVILLQNVKIVKFRDMLEVTSVPVSSLLVLLQSHELIASKGVQELLLNFKLGETAQVKLRRVLHWAFHTESAFHNVKPDGSIQKKLKNWKEDVKMNLINCSCISEIMELKESCCVNLFALIGEVVNQRTWIPIGVEHLVKMPNNKVVDYLIGTGCKLCGTPMGTGAESKIPLYCQKSSNYVHEVSFIYKPFMLRVWDDSGQIPILVDNKAAEVLFGKITAENVYRCYQLESQTQSTSQHTSKFPVDPSQKHLESSESEKKLDFYHIWLIMLKLLLKQGENSPFQFQISIDPNKDLEAGRYELVFIKMPCKRSTGISSTSA